MNLCAVISREYEAQLHEAVAATGYTVLDICVDGKDTRNPNTAIQQQTNGQPDILLVDLTTALKFSWQTLHRVRLGAPDTRIILLDEDENNPIFPDCVKCGIWDFVIVSDPDDLTNSIITAIEHPANYKAASKYASIATDTEPTKAAKVAQPKKPDAPAEEIHIVEERPIGRTSIAVAGTLPRSGCTTTAIFIARTLADKGMRVGLWMANQQHFVFIREAYNDVEIHDEHHFTLDGVDFHAGELHDVGDYPYLILDLGVLNGANHTELKRSSVKIMLSGYKDWELPALGAFLDQAEKTGEKIRNYLYFFLHVTNDDLREIRHSMKGMECIGVPIIYNPFVGNTEFAGIIEGVLQPFLPNTYQQKQPRPRRPLFSFGRNKQ